MVLCKFFMQGHCRYGDKCWNEHPRGNRDIFDARQKLQGGQNQYNVNFKDSFAAPNQNPFQVLNNQGDGRGGGGGGRGAAASQSIKDMSSTDILNAIKTEIDIWERGKMWPLSCLSFGKEIGCLPGLEDMSMEEVRLKAYEAKISNSLEAYKQWLTQLTSQATNVKRTMMQPDLQTKQRLNSVIKDLQNQAPSQSQIGNSTQSQNTFGGGPTFGGQKQTTFGGQNNTTSATSVFGGGQQNQTQTTSLFGHQSQSTFGGQSDQSTSVFGASNQSNSVFGGGSSTQNKSVFGGQTTAPPNQNVFGGQNQPVFGGQTAQQTTLGSTQPKQNVFGGQTTPQTQPQSVFGGQNNQSQNTFGGNQAAQPQNTQQQNVFGGQTQNNQSGSVFGQTGQSGSVFGNQQTAAQQQPQNTFGGQPQSGATTTLFGKPATLSAPSTQTVGVFGGNAQPGQPTNVFGGQQAPAPSANQNVFGGTSATNTQTTFGGTAPTTFGGGASVNQSSLGGGATNVTSSSVYTPIDKLTADELEQFKAPSFTIGKIPCKPPPKELVH